MHADHYRHRVAYGTILIAGSALFGGLPVGVRAQAGQAYYLQAGPLHVKFQDGELRYLYVGNKEVVRRVYFAVRDANWNTIMPQFSRIAVQNQGTGFTIALTARCQSSMGD